jgi:hypothetical protein
MTATALGVSVNGTLKIRDGIASPSVTAPHGSNLVLGTSQLAGGNDRPSSSVEFAIGNATVGRVSARGFEVDAGKAVVIGETTLYAPAEGGNGRNSTPVLALGGALGGAGSLHVSGNLQAEGEAFVRGTVRIGGDLVLHNPSSDDRRPQSPASGSEACAQVIAVPPDSLAPTRARAHWPHASRLRHPTARAAMPRAHLAATRETLSASIPSPAHPA